LWDRGVCPFQAAALEFSSKSSTALRIGSLHPALAVMERKE